MRRLWRIVRILAVIPSHTLYLVMTAWHFRPQDRAYYRARRQQAGCRLLCKILNIQVTLEGRIPEENPALIVCNHFGVLDPIVLGSAMPVAFVAKSEMRRWVLIGWMARQMGVIFVDRQRRTMTRAFLDSLWEKLHSGVSVLVFPEGTTGRGDRVLPFKTGAFAAVAEKEQGVVIPLYLRPVRVNGIPAVGAVRDMLTWSDSPQTFVEHVWGLLGVPGIDMQIRVGSPVSTASRSRKELARLLHTRVVALAEETSASVDPTEANKLTY